MQSFFFVYLKQKFVKINIEDIQYIVSVAHHIKIVTEQGVFIPHIGLKEIEAILPPDHFTRVNRATIVALDRVTTFNLDTVYLSEVCFPFSEGCRKEFQKKINIVMHRRG